MDEYIKFGVVMEYLRNRSDEARECGHEETYFDLLTIINGFRNVETIPASALGKDIDVPVKWVPVSERLPEISEKDVYGNVTFSKPVWACMKYGDGFTWQGIDQYTTNNGGGWLSEVPFDDPEECSKVVAWMPLPEPYKEGEQG